MKEGKGVSVFAAGSVLAAITASLCCILPIVFALTGFSILGASALFDAWRPYLLVLTLGLLTLGFFAAYRPSKEECAPGSACPAPKVNRSGRLMLWLAAGAVILFSTFPYYSGFVAELLLSGSSSAASDSSKLSHASFAIQGMDCAACAGKVESKLKAIKGVRDVSVSVESRRAEIDYDPEFATLSQMQRAIEDAGYEAQTI